MVVNKCLSNKSQELHIYILIEFNPGCIIIMNKRKAFSIKDVPNKLQ